MRRARGLGAIAVALSQLLYASRACAQELVPVPAEWTQGSRLVLASAECSIDAPGPGWRWLCPAQPPAEGAIEVRCEGPDPTLHWFLHVERERLGRLTREQAEDFVDKLDGALARARGLTLERLSCEPSDVPIAGHSFRFVNRLRDGQGESLYSHGYLASGHRIFVLGELARSKDEPPELATSARSFQVLRSAASPSPGAQSPAAPRERPSVGTIVAVLAIPATVLLAGLVAFVIAWRRREASEA